MVFIMFLCCAAAYDKLLAHGLPAFQTLYFLSSFFGAPLLKILYLYLLLHARVLPLPSLPARMTCNNVTTLLQAVSSNCRRHWPVPVRPLRLHAAAFTVMCAASLRQNSHSAALGALLTACMHRTMRAGQFGPNATTWLLPGEVFPTDIRATCHGISAATGKVGALVAGIWFAYLSNAGQVLRRRLLSTWCATLPAKFLPVQQSLEGLSAEAYVGVRLRRLHTSHAEQTFCGP